MKNMETSKRLRGLLAATALMASLVACGKKTDDNNNQINAFTQSCVNCQNISGYPFFTTETSGYYARTSGYGYGGYGYGYGVPTMKISWSFSGQNVSGSATGQSYNQWASPAMNYVGQVSAAGTVNISTPINFGFCPAVPAGQYNLTTQTVGQWNQGQISGLKFIFGGPVTMTGYLAQAQAYDYGYQYGNSNSSRITNGVLVIEQVNGYYCQGAQLQLY